MKKKSILIYFSILFCNCIIAQNIIYKYYDQKGIQIQNKDSSYYTQNIEFKDSIFVSKMFYSQNMMPFKTISFKDSNLTIKHGQIMEYKNGTLLLIGKYLNNTRIGEWVYFNDKFVPKKIFLYKKDGSFDTVPISQRFNVQFNYIETLDKIDNTLAWKNFMNNYPKEIIDYTENILKNVKNKLHKERVLQTGFHIIFDIDSTNNKLKFITSSQPIYGVYNDIATSSSITIKSPRIFQQNARFKETKINPLLSKYNFGEVIANSIQNEKDLFLNLKNSTIASNKYLVVHYLLKMKYLMNY